MVDRAGNSINGGGGHLKLRRQLTDPSINSYCYGIDNNLFPCVNMYIEHAVYCTHSIDYLTFEEWG